MGMPNDLVLVRHGQSEGNVATDAAKQGDTSMYTEAFTTTPGHQWRLTDWGRREARAIGGWLASEFDNGAASRFDRYYVSPYVRARETAGHLALPDARWMSNRALRERDWGEIGSMPRDQFETEFPHSAKQKRIDPLYWVAPGGESIAQVAEDRVRNVLSTLHRECASQRVLAVTHGEVMWAFRLVLERLDDLEFVALDDDKSEKIHNCEAFHYTRVDPVSGTLASRLTWRRRCVPVGDSPSLEVSVGPWVEIPFSTRSNAELLDSVASARQLFD
jgi:broad specificity phosphatase PhoE